MKYRKDDIFAGRYKLVKHLGTGGFAEVWKAEDHMADGSIVALKIFAPDKGLDADGLTVFRREYSLTLPLRHNHLLTASYFDVMEGSPFLVMPYCSEGSLMTKIVNHHEFSEKAIADVMNQLTDGLVYLHENGITHQDMKPDNVMILKPGYYVLADFGISTRIRRSVARSMRAEQAKSYSAFTPAYAPPEKYISKPTPSGDIFSLGVTLYECLTGDVPFEDIGAALERGATIPDLPEKYSKELNDLLQKCMSVDPASRPTANELNYAVETYLAKGVWPLTGNAEPAVETKKPSKRSRKTVLMGDAEFIQPKVDNLAVKTVLAKSSVEEKEEKKRPWLIPALIISVLLLGTFAGINILSSGKSKRLAKEEALKKETFTKTFFQNMLDSTSGASSIEQLAFLQSRVDYEKDSGQLFDEQHFDFASFDMQWKNRQQTLFTMDSITMAAVFQDSVAQAKTIADSIAIAEKEKVKPRPPKETPTPPKNVVDEEPLPLPSLEEIKKKIQEEGKYPSISTGQLFQINRAYIRTTAYPLLDALAVRLKELDTGKLEIGVHTDNMGNDEMNMKLSQRRADAIRHYLLSKGVSEGKITAKGYGETKPIASNATSRGKAQNRRVVLSPIK